MARTLRPNGAAGDRDDPWIETREGGLFFINALLIFPHLMLFVPLLTRTVVRAVGGLEGESRIVDTFPLIAEYLLPRAGWLLVVPIALSAYAIRVTLAPWPRAALGIFLTLHLSLLGWTVGVWFGLWPPTLPGSP